MVTVACSEVSSEATGVPYFAMPLACIYTHVFSVILIYHNIASSNHNSSLSCNNCACSM